MGCGSSKPKQTVHVPVGGVQRYRPPPKKKTANSTTTEVPADEKDIHMEENVGNSVMDVVITVTDAVGDVVHDKELEKIDDTFTGDDIDKVASEIDSTRPEVCNIVEPVGDRGATEIVLPQLSTPATRDDLETDAPVEGTGNGGVAEDPDDPNPAGVERAEAVVAEITAGDLMSNVDVDPEPSEESDHSTHMIEGTDLGVDEDDDSEDEDDQACDMAPVGTTSSKSAVAAIIAKNEKKYRRVSVAMNRKVLSTKSTSSRKVSEYEEGVNKTMALEKQRVKMIRENTLKNFGIDMEEKVKKEGQEEDDDDIPKPVVTGIISQRVRRFSQPSADMEDDAEAAIRSVNGA